MRSFQPKRGLKDIAHSKPVLVLLVFLMLFFAWGIVGFFGKLKITKENRKIAENKMIELEKEKEKLTSDINKLKTPDGVEASIRDKFGLAKEGERMIVVVDDKNPPEAPKESSSDRFFSFFRNLFR